MNFLRFLLMLPFFMLIKNAHPLTPRYAAIVMDAESGKVLEQDNADILCHPASLTKIMTLFMVFEALKSGKLSLSTQIPVSYHAARQIPSKLGLRPGEYVSVETVIKGLVTKSANDAAAAIGEYLGGSESNFATMMTRRGKSLGMERTIFKNASGVPNPNQVTTARDMALLSRALYRSFPKEYRYFRLKSFNHRGRVHANHNHLLGKVPGLDGIKTGYVAASGSNLAASAVRTGHNNITKRLIVVVLGGPNRHWRDRRVSDLMESNFQQLGLGMGSGARPGGMIAQATVYKHKHRDDNIDDPYEHTDEDALSNLVDATHDEDIIPHSPKESFDEDESEVDHFLKKAKAEMNQTRKDKPQPAGWVVGKHSPVKSSFKASFKSPIKLIRKKAPLWGVQVGTYRTIGEAKRVASKTHATINTGEISTPLVVRGKNSSYGARLFNLTREEADRVCQKHAPKGKECRILGG